MNSLTLINNVILLGIAGLTAYNTWLSQYKLVLAEKTLAAIKQTEMAVKQTEINTNSMKDALVATTARASHAEGLAEGRLENVNKK